MPRPEVVLYARHGCHLCEEARELLEKYGLEPGQVDIDADPELQRRFTDCVPVIEIDGQNRFRGRVSEVLLRRLLAARYPELLRRPTSFLTWLGWGPRRPSSET